MLERMDVFFENRLEEYDRHMLECIEGSREFYPFTAKCLPLDAHCRVLDLGCGTGLELEEYFRINKDASVTGIDLSRGMLEALKNKLSDYDIKLCEGSYFDLPFGYSSYDAAVSVESLHHFTKDEKIPLYKKLYTALKANGYFILTDYFAQSDEEENEHQNAYHSLKKEQGIIDGAFYHYDTPLTVDHEREALLAAGFSRVEILSQWGETYTLRATK